MIVIFFFPFPFFPKKNSHTHTHLIPFIFISLSNHTWIDTCLNHIHKSFRVIVSFLYHCFPSINFFYTINTPFFCKVHMPVTFLFYNFIFFL
eukprot:UN04388